jgi:hypothetical protein
LHAGSDFIGIHNRFSIKVSSGSTYSLRKRTVATKSLFIGIQDRQVIGKSSPSRSKFTPIKTSNLLGRKWHEKRSKVQ